MSSRVLVVDDKELMRDSVATMLTRIGWTVQAAGDGRAAIKMISERRPDVVLTDLAMPGMDGIELLREIRKIDEQLPVVLMTAYATVQTAVEAMKRGAFDYLTKPFDGDELILTIRRALKHGDLMKENAVLRSQLPRAQRERQVPLLIGETPVMLSLKDQIGRIAQSHSTVLIMGESGVGKEVVAQYIHALSRRSKSPMLAINCAALSVALLESELFGHERGSFTGAERLRKGRFELADGGTLFLDEISEIPANIQAKLLRVLQERAFERVGSSVTQRTDVRVLATTNRDIRQAVAQGRFRQDLYFRLNVLPISVPPLRDRRNDIPLLCEYFLKVVAEREGRSPQRFEPEAIELLKQYSWPGNVRELYNICERAAIFSVGEETIPAATIASWLNTPVREGMVVPVTPICPASLEVNPILPVDEALFIGLAPSAPAPSESGAIDLGSRPSPPVARRTGSERGERFRSTESVEAFSTRPLEGEGGEADVEVVDSASDLDCAVVIMPGVAAHRSFAGNRDDDPSAVSIPTEGRALEDIERDVIIATLRRHGGHRQRTARELKIGVRTLGLKLRKWKDQQLVAEDL